MKASNHFKKLLMIAILVCVISLSFKGFLQAQTWTALPPYNFLWPLWSSALSPVDPATGLKTPIVSSLYPNTILPLQPGLAWNPIFSNPYFLYNSPIGMQYYDLTYGFNPWPPSYVIDPATGAGLSLTLPAGYQYLAPTDSQWITTNTPIANLAYISQYPTWALSAYASSLPPNTTGINPWLAYQAYPTPAFSSLLTPGQILGYVPAPIPSITTTGIPPTVAAPILPITTTTATLFNPLAAFLALSLLGLF